MSVVSHQTIRLSPGRHASPAEGACVMELASMLAGEEFSDHPRSVCPVIGSLLRAYNDTIDGDRRQDLYVYAAAVVGSRGDARVERARAARVADWTLEMRRRRLRRILPGRSSRAVARIWRVRSESLGTHAVHAITRFNDKNHASVLSLIDELLAIGKRGAVRSDGHHRRQAASHPATR